MALVKNIHSGLTAWTGSGTSYTAGQRRSNGGNAYQCITAGTGAASGGPSGTGLLIQDNTAWWTWLSAIDYTDVATFVAGLPSTTYTQMITGQLWNDALYNPTLGVGVSWFAPASGTPTSSFPLILTAAPGESICDTLHARPQGSVPLTTSQTYGVTTSMANSAGQSNWLDLNLPYTTISRIQILDPISTSQSTPFNMNATATNLIVDSMIIDGYAQTGGAQLIYINSPTTTIRNCLMIDRQTNAGGVPNIYFDASSTSTTMTNCTHIAPNSPPSTYGIVHSCATVGSLVVTNDAFFGYPFGIITCTAVSGGASLSYCCTDAATIGYQATNGGSILFSKTASNQFISATTDFRIKSNTADLYNTGTAKPTQVPGLCDIAGTPRPQGYPYWDIGCWEFLVPIVYRRNLIRLRMKHLQNADPCDLSRRDWKRLADHFRDGYLTGVGRWI